MYTSLMAWTDSILENRTFTVPVKGSTSGPRAVVSGGPLGSVQGPSFNLSLGLGTPYRRNGEVLV